jgi:predicted transcriptional regulator
MTREELVIQATKDIVVAAIGTENIMLDRLPSFIQQISEAMNKAYENCHTPPSIG